MARSDAVKPTDKAQEIAERALSGIEEALGFILMPGDLHVLRERLLRALEEYVPHVTARHEAALSLIHEMAIELEPMLDPRPQGRGVDFYVRRAGLCARIIEACKSRKQPEWNDKMDQRIRAEPEEEEHGQA